MLQLKLGKSINDCNRLEDHGTGTQILWKLLAPWFHTDWMVTQISLFVLTASLALSLQWKQWNKLDYAILVTQKFPMTSVLNFVLQEHSNMSQGCYP
jgi:hypothetical protein